MNHWPTTTIETIFDIGAGKTMSSKVREGDELTPFLRTSNVFWSELDLTKIDEMPMSGKDRAQKGLMPGDLLVCEGGAIGRSAVWNGEIENISFQNHLHRLRRKSEEVDPAFYALFLEAGFTQLGIFGGAGNNTTIPNLSRSRLEQLIVPKPDYDEQVHVRRSLLLIRSAIKNQVCLIETTEELKRAALHELFKRGLRGEAQKDSEIGPIPKSWEAQILLDVCDFQSGGTPRKSVTAYWQGDIPWVSGKDLKKPVLKDVADHITEEAAVSGSKIAPVDSVLILVRGMGLAKDLPISRIAVPMAFNQDIKALMSKCHITGSYLRSAIYNRKEALLGRIVPSAHGTMTLNLDDLETFLIPCPSDPAEVQEITDVIDAIDAKIDLHNRKRKLLEELFRALLHKLMTGEVRVSDLNLAGLEAEAAT